ncbi:MAG: hypothetical protein EP334_05555 [Gammaproteobacteria bacterium]|nr:MAG: hypothetical protein EP334_05555 [Gammaproteobacteria bacterium]
MKTDISSVSKNKLRYFSPLEHNSPTSLNELFKWNDVELFDLENDGEEMRNLAVDRVTHRDLIVTTNTKLEAVIKTESGVDGGPEPPNTPFIDWELDLERTS